MDAFGVKAMERRRSKIIDLCRDYWDEELQELVLKKNCGPWICRILFTMN